MTNELPIACSLGAGDLTHRLDEIAALGRDALLDSDLDGTRATLRFAASPGIEQRLAKIVAAESECCAFLTMRVRDEGDALMLSITAPAGAEVMLGEFVDGFRRDRAVAR